MQVDLKTLIGKLNRTCRKGLEAAAALCVSQTHYNVEIEHFLLELLNLQDTDLRRLLRFYEVQPGEVGRELTRAMERVKRGNSRTPALSPHIIQLLREAWMLSSLHLGTDVVRSGVLLLALFEHEALRGLLLESAPTLLRIPRASLAAELRFVCYLSLSSV